MKTTFRAALLALAAASMAVPAAAQSDILLRLRSGSPPGDRFRVDSAGSVVALSELGIGIIPATGCGERMMWYGYRGAFRAGTTDDGGACSYWDDFNIGFYSWAGGNLSMASAFTGFAFGDQVEVTSVSGTGFGASNTVSGTAGFTAGALNTCGASYCVAMGYTANASGTGAVAIGYRTTANANYSVALGYRASVNEKAGAFVIADQSTTDSLEASATNQFSSRYAGGYRLYTNATTTTGVFINPGSGSWSAFSDRNHKELFRPVDGEEVLARIRTIPVTTWRYLSEQDRTVRHIGPMAQDWQRAFGFSGDSTTINTGDFDGVNLAAVQALEARTTRQASELEALRAELAASRGENAALRGDVEALRAANETMEARLRRLEAAAARTP